MKILKTSVGFADGKVMPSAPEIEAAALGAAIADATCVETAVTLLGAEMFYVEAHALVFEAVLELYADGQKIDMLTVVQRLKKNGNLERAGGSHCISELCSKVGSGAHIEYHCRIILQKYIQRQLIEAGNRIIETGFDETLDTQAALERAQKLISGVSDIAEGRRSVKKFTEIIDTALDDCMRRMNAVRAGKPTGITTGLRDLDAKILGWQKSNLIILAGRPGQGKSALMLHFAKSAARAGIPPVVFALEMSDVALADRMILSVCNVAAYRYRTGYLSNPEFDGVESAGAQLKEFPVTIDDTPLVSMSQIRAKARALHRAGKCGMVFIDYLQLIKADLSYGKNMNNAISEISREAKILAKEIDVPVMLLSQLNREVERRADKRPQLSDLRDSGAIEQDADIVMFVYRPAYYGIHEPEMEQSGIITVAKFREGAVGDVTFSHNESLTRIYDYGTLPF